MSLSVVSMLFSSVACDMRENNAKAGEGRIGGGDVLQE